MSNVVRVAVVALGLGALGARAWAQVQPPADAAGARRPHMHYHYIPQADVQGRVEMFIFIIALLGVLRVARLALAERPWSKPDDPARVTAQWRSARRQTAGLLLGLIVGVVLTPILPHQHASHVSLEGHDHHAAEPADAHAEEDGLFHVVFFPVLGGALGSLLGLAAGLRMKKRAAGPEPAARGSQPDKSGQTSGSS